MSKVEVAGKFNSGKDGKESNAKGITEREASGGQETRRQAKAYGTCQGRRKAER